MCVNSLQQMERVRVQLKKLRNLINEIDGIDGLEEPDRYRWLCEEAVMVGEKMTCGLRNFALTFSDEPSPELMDKSVKTLGITVTKEQDTVKIEIPFMLPKKRHKNSNFLKEPLRHALRKAAEKCDLKINERALICFMHGYDCDEKLYRIRDYDNEEAKPILDCIALEILTDDSAEFCDVYHTIRNSKDGISFIYVMPERVSIASCIKKNL